MTVPFSDAQLPSTWLTNCADPSTWLQSPIKKIVGCKVLQFIHMMKIKKMFGHKTLRCTYTATSSRERDELGKELHLQLISVIFTWFLLFSYLLKFLFFLYFFWFDLIYIYIYLFICALKEWEDFRLIYKGFTCKVGLGQLNQVNLHPARHEFNRRPTQLNSSPIRIRISACTSVSIFGITFGSDIQLRWFKLGWKFNLKG